MIKGAQHRIIEIRQTDDPYFERALLFVRVDLSSHSEELLEQEGRRFLAAAGRFTGLRQDRAMRWFKRAALLLCGGFMGTVLGAVLVQMG